MDGVLIDSLNMDIEVVNRIMRSRYNRGIEVSFIKSVFAYDVPEFWDMIVKRAGIDASGPEMDQLISEYRSIRQSYPIKVLPGVVELLDKLKEEKIPRAVASNNSDEDIRMVLKSCGLNSKFDMIVGNDNIARKKPEPDIYIYAAGRLGVDIKRSVVVEDSLLGIQAGLASGARVIAVATGSADYQELLGTDAALVLHNLAELNFEVALKNFGFK